MFYNNRTALHKTSSQVSHEKTKHIEVECHFLRDKIVSGDISTPFVKTEDQLVEVFMKSLNDNRLRFICSKLGYII